MGGEVRDIVPVLSGIHAFGGEAARPLLDRASETDAGVPGIDAVDGPIEPTGVTGFMRKPLMMAGAGEAGVVDRDAPAGERGGGGGRTFSR